MHYLDTSLSLLESSLTPYFNVSLLHASLFPLCALLKLHPQCPFPSSPPTTPDPSSLALLRTLSSPSSSSEAVTLCVIALSLHHSCGGGTARTVVEALLPQAHDTGSYTGEGCGPDEQGTTNLSAALSSGFLGLLNALSTCSDSGGGMCFLDGALSEEVALLPLPPTHLTRVVVACLVACLEECERVKLEGEASGSGGGSDEGGHSEAADLLPSPLRARVAEGPKVLYASDARVALEIALRAAGDLSPDAAEPWVTLLVGLQRFSCKGYKQAEVEALFQEGL